MFSFFPKSKRHYLKKNAKSLTELGHAFRNRRIHETKLFMQCSFTFAALFFVAGFGKVFFVFYTASNVPYNHYEGIKLPNAESERIIEISTERKITISLSSETIKVNWLDTNLESQSFEEVKLFLGYLRDRVPSSQICLRADKDLSMNFIHKLIQIIKESVPTDYYINFGSNIHFITK